MQAVCFAAVVLSHCSEVKEREQYRVHSMKAGKGTEHAV